MSGNTEDGGWQGWLEQLHQSGLLIPFAWHFAHTVCALGNSATKVALDQLFLAAAVAAHNTFANKHVCTPLEPLPKLRDIIVQGGEEQTANMEGVELPSALLTYLRGPECAFAVAVNPPTGEVPLKPLVLEDTRLYLQRYWVLECQLAHLLKGLTQRATAPQPTRAFGQWTKLTLDKTQLATLEQIAPRKFAIVTGGPGSGKTTIVSVLLAEILRTNPACEIVLCAPTGKAQARLKEAVEAEIEHNLRLDNEKTVREKMCGLRYATIHRLLGSRPPLNHFKYNAQNPLSTDVVVVDEASMVDLALMVKLLSALKSDCRLFLLGDSDQLAAVEAGAVLAEICDAWRNQPTVARLKYSHRFKKDGGIDKLKEAINAGTDSAAWLILQAAAAEPKGELALATAPRDQEECTTNLTELLRQNNFRDYLSAETPQEAFARFDSFRVLCATHHGVCGVVQVNQTIPQILGIKPYTHGWPVMVTRNDYANQLYNGDIGLCLSSGEDGGVRVYFSDSHQPGTYRSFTRAQLPEHTSAFAMTIHKAQGSGFDKVLLMLPTWDTPLLTRELLYTGVTRAKTRCTLWVDENIFTTAVVKRTVRMSGLADKL